MSLYFLVMCTHSYLRWAVVALAALVCGVCTRGWSDRSGWSAGHERLHKMFVGVVDAQFTLGLLLYLWLSPYVRAFYAGPGAAMKDATLRFFGIEHVFSMVIAVSIIHIARSRSKKLAGAPRHRRVLLSTLAALVLIAVAIPWPFMPYGRPLLRALP